MDDKISTDPILADIELALALHGLSATKFGYASVGDPALLSKLRKGMHLRPHRAARVRMALAKLKEGKGL